MQRTFLKLLAIIVCMNLAGMSRPAVAQSETPTQVQMPTQTQPQPQPKSLAEIARENKEKLAAQDSGVKPKVITNQDLGEGPEGRPDLRVQPRTMSADYRPGQRFAGQRGEQWRRQISEQESRVANLQARLDRINESLRLNGNAQGSYSRYQAIQTERAQQIQIQLDEQSRRLDAMQDAARRAGAFNP